MGSRLLGVIAIGLLCGCASTSDAVRFARGEEVMCKHCNCLMPAGVDAGAMCPVCNCERQAHECVRGR